jgi:hypothetical protein
MEIFQKQLIVQNIGKQNALHSPFTSTRIFHTLHSNFCFRSVSIGERCRFIESCVLRFLLRLLLCTHPRVLVSYVSAYVHIHYVTRTLMKVHLG